MRLRKDRGLTLLELVVAVLVLSIGSLAALRGIDRARLTIGGGTERVLAALAAANRAEELRLPDADSLPDRVELGGRSFTLSTEREATAGGLQRAEVRAQADGGAGAIRVVYLVPGRP